MVVQRLASALRSCLLRLVSLGAIAVLTVLGPGSTARAGSCPICTSSAECTSFDDGGVAFCVRHDGPVGCGAELTLCCPGQGCNTFSGRPSCEGTTCTVIEDLVDGGPVATDGGGPGTDGGPTFADACECGADAGASPGDSGTARMDAGGTTPPVTTAACGCRMGTRAGRVRGLAAFGVAAAAVVLPRRRRARP